MPWSSRQASGKTRKANTREKKRRWAKTANAVLKKTGDEGRAVRIANATMKRKRKR